MSDLQSILTDRTENIIRMVDNRTHVEPGEPKTVRVVQVVDLDASSK